MRWLWLVGLGGCAEPTTTPDPTPFADRVVSFLPGAGAGFGAELMPDVVLGPPLGAGPNAGSTDVVSLGDGGEIVLEFCSWRLEDGPGPDLLVFENAFVGWVELGQVAASVDGVDWQVWPCDAGSGEGCAGVEPVLAPGDGLDPTDPDQAGGDAFDLADLGLDSASFVRVTDIGVNSYEGTTGGFDLDALAAVGGAAVPGGCE